MILLQESGESFIGIVNRKEPNMSTTKDKKFKIFIKRVNKVLEDMPRIGKGPPLLTQKFAFEKNIVRHATNLKRDIQIYRKILKKKTLA